MTPTKVKLCDADIDVRCQNQCPDYAVIYCKNLEDGKKLKSQILEWQQFYSNYKDDDIPKMKKTVIERKRKLKKLRKQYDKNQQALKLLSKKAERYDNSISWLRANLTDAQLTELSIVSDPLSRKILVHLASEESQK